MASTKRKAPAIKVAKPHVKKSVAASVTPFLNEKYSDIASVPKIPGSRQPKDEEATVLAISSDEEELDEMDEDEDSEKEADEDEEDAPSAEGAKTNGLPAVNGTAKENVDDDEEDGTSDHEPTFGDLVRSHETIDVSMMLGLTHQTSATEGQGNNVQRADESAANGKSQQPQQPTLASLGNLLNAALRNNDDDNLDVCLNMSTNGSNSSSRFDTAASSALSLAALPASTAASSNNTAWMRNTIRRMDPALSGRLLQKLAARMYQRPGRAQTLVGWVQWILITHGGVLASQPGVSEALQDLYQVLEERARGLNSLLLLKGKLDMLEAQMQMRRSQRTALQKKPKAADGSNRKDAAKAKRNYYPGITIYMEGQRNLERENRYLGQENGDNSDSIRTVPGEILVTDATTMTTTAADLPGILEQSDEDGEEMDDMEDDEDDDSEDDDELDDEDDEDGVDFDDLDGDLDSEADGEDAEEEEEAEAVPPAKIQKKSASTFSKRR